MGRPFKGREGIFDGVSHKFPVAAGRILTHGDFFHEAVGTDDVRIFRMNVGDLPQAHAAQIGQAQGNVCVDVAVGIGPFIAEAFGIGSSAGADAVGNDDDDAIEFHVLPSL